MSKKLNCIMLVDDNPHDNFFSERVIKESGKVDLIIIKENGLLALEYLTHAIQQNSPLPDLLFLDINMPLMSGWEFLKEFEEQLPFLQNKIVIVMLSTSDYPDDIEKAKKIVSVSDYKTKPLTKEMLNGIIDQYF